MADWAELADWPTRLGTPTQLPFDTTMLTELLGCTLAPVAGFCDDTSPLPNWLEQALVCVPTLRLAPFRIEPAAAGDCPRTLGTETVVCVPDTVNTTGVVCLTLDPPV